MEECCKNEAWEKSNWGSYRGCREDEGESDENGEEREECKIEGGEECQRWAEVEMEASQGEKGRGGAREIEKEKERERESKRD